MSRQRLPLGIQTFREIREGDYCYVDKTAEAEVLAGHGKAYFLSGPRRFGESLFVDTAQRCGDLSFRLRVPNHEVRVALNNQFIDAYAGISDMRLSYKRGLIESLTQGELPGLVATIKRLFASIPWRNFTNNELPQAEGYYASVLYAFFAGLDAEIIPEDLSNPGQVDLTLKLAGYIYVIEIKLVQDKPPAANPALAQIQARGYSEQYRDAPGQGIFEVGLVFSSTARNLVQADWRHLDSSLADTGTATP